MTKASVQAVPGKVEKDAFFLGLGGEVASEKPSTGAHVVHVG